MSPGGAAHTKARARATRTRSENRTGPGGTEAEDGASGNETGEAHRSSVSASCVLGTGQLCPAGTRHRRPTGKVWSL